MAQSRVGIVLLTAGITAVITSVFWIGLGAAVYWYFSNEQPDFVVNIESPETASTGEQIQLTVAVSNPTDERLELGSIDIYESLLDGFDILTIDPSPDSRDDSFGFASLYFSESLEPGETFKAILELEAQSAGVWTGDIDCCTPLERFVTTSHTIVVTDSSPVIEAAGQGSADQTRATGKPKPEGKEKPELELEERLP